MNLLWKACGGFRAHTCILLLYWFSLIVNALLFFFPNKYQLSLKIDIKGVYSLSETNNILSAVLIT